MNQDQNSHHDVWNVWDILITIRNLVEDYDDEDHDRRKMVTLRAAVSHLAHRGADLAEAHLKSLTEISESTSSGAPASEGVACECCETVARS